MEQNRRSLRSQDLCFQKVQKDVVTQKSANSKSKMRPKILKSKQDSTCDVCLLKFHTAQALRAHKNAKHPSAALKPDSSPDSRSKASPKNTPAAAATSRVSKRLQLRKSHDKDTEESENSEDENMEEKPDKIEFRCPKCDKMFSIYFQALKHIEKKHCEDSRGNPVSPNSPDIIKPVSVETCSKCNNHIDSTHNCDCTEIMHERHNNILFCLGCDKQFQNVAAFNLHATNMHRNNLDSMFFKTFEEFNMWKQMMETQVKVKYLGINKANSQKFYQCNYVSPKNEYNKTYLCPSIVVYKGLSAGIQIYYFTEHHGHEVPEYQLPEEFSHNLTNKLEAKSEIEIKNEFDVLINKDPDDDLYIKFKDLMENISIDAERVSISHLRKLFNSALEMQGLLNSYYEDNDDTDATLINKSMTDAQITDALEGKRTSARLKRKSETRISLDTKKKKEDKSDENMDSKSKKDENANKSVSKENKEFDSPNVKVRSSPTLLSPSFNDTYKQFIGPQLDSSKKSKNTKPKEIVKTKMGQFSPKKKLPVKETVEKRQPNILKPSKSNSMFVKDIKYEVREQENDCNILILKI